MRNETTYKVEELEDWIQRYGSPLYLYDITRIEKQIDKLKRGLHPAIKLFYSLKANPNPSLVHQIAQQGVGAEVCSEAELQVALTAGISPQNMIFLGPGKQEKELVHAIQSGLRYLIIESQQEAFLLNRLCQELGVRLSIGVRINPRQASLKARLLMGGLARQFGVDEEQIDGFLEQAKALKSLTISGFHMYVGTQNLSEESIIDNGRYILNLASLLSRKYNLELEFVGIGGGMGLKYSDSEDYLDTEKLSEGLTDEINLFQRKHGREIEILLESGRFVVGESGTYVCRVLYTKDSHGKRFVVVDGGTHHFSPAFMSPFTKFKNDLIEPFVKSERKEMLQTIAGPLCTPSDILSKSVLLPELYPGDMISFKKAGAYGLTAAPLLFLSHDLPQEVMIRGNQSVLIRHKAEYISPQLRTF